jgi:hypothetical protein
MKNNYKSCLLAAIFLFAVNACTLFKKGISKPVTVSLSDSTFLAEKNAKANYIKYLDLQSPEKLTTAFLKGFKSEGAITKNVTLKFNDDDADFILKVKSLVVTESSKIETINDPKSPFNGQQVELNKVESSVTIEIIDTKNKTKKFMNCFNSKERTEKLKNNRDIGDLITGSNKDNTQYRTKLLSDNICLNLSEDVGRRVWVPITRRIVKAIK